MYNPATQVQVSADANLGFYFQKNKIDVGASPTAFPFKKNISPSKNIINLFGNWLEGVEKKERAQIQVGVCALLWAIWHVCNDYIINRAKPNSFMQVIPLATHWILYVVLPTTNGQARRDGF
jgi:hypothetical protein